MLIGDVYVDDEYDHDGDKDNDDDDDDDNVITSLFHTVQLNSGFFVHVVPHGNQLFFQALKLFFLPYFLRVLELPKSNHHEASSCATVATSWDTAIFTSSASCLTSSCAYV